MDSPFGFPVLAESENVNKDAPPHRNCSQPRPVSRRRHSLLPQEECPLRQAARDERPRCTIAQATASDAGDAGGGSATNPRSAACPLSLAGSPSRDGAFTIGAPGRCICPISWSAGAAIFRPCPDRLPVPLPLAVPARRTSRPPRQPAPWHPDRDRRPAVPRGRGVHPG